jgi:hypothetical protein
VSLRLLIPAAAKALREAEDGLTLQELGATIGTRWPDRVVRAMQRDGYAVGEEAGRLHLGVDVERITDTAGLILPAREKPRRSRGLAVGDSLSVDTLFPVEHEPRSPYDLDCEAA